MKKKLVKIQFPLVMIVLLVIALIAFILVFSLKKEEVVYHAPSSSSYGDSEIRSGQQVVEINITPP
jgi:hypothetical protein